MKPGRLQLLVMHVSTRCDQTCAHCSIWKGTTAQRAELGEAERIQILQEARRLGAHSVLLTGGEPLLCRHIERLARTAHEIGMRVQLATNGLGLSRASSWIEEVVSEVYVSLEGPERVHDGVRGMGAFARLKASLSAIAILSERPRLIGRCVISSRNAAFLEEVVGSARELGLDGVSFLPVDVTSEAFGGKPQERKALRLSSSDAAAMEAGVKRLHAMGVLGSFVLEDERKLRAMGEAFAAEPESHSAPRCNAPEWSSVVEADGAIRPCFFQPVVELSRGRSLEATRESAEYISSLSRLGPGNPSCAACVCPKNLATGLGAWKARVRSALIRWQPQSGRKTVRAA